MNALQRILWLARRNFVRGSFWNFASVFLVAVSSLVFFCMYLFLFHPNPTFITRYVRFSWLTGWMMALILLIAFIALLVIFYLINRVRYHEIGVLRGIGAKRSFIFMMIFFEIFFVVAAGAVLAVLLGFIGGRLGGDAFDLLFRIPAGFKGFLAVSASGLLAVVSITLVAVTAALFPAVVICSIEPYTAIRKQGIIMITKILNVGKSYGYGNSKRNALKGVSLDINEGDFIAILGPSGSEFKNHAAFHYRLSYPADRGRSLFQQEEGE